MKICVAQTRPVKGDIRSNLENHKKLINLAILYEADIIIFPELSLTGYEPSLAKELSINPDDIGFNDFQKISNASQLIIGVGIPAVKGAGVCISMILFQPRKARQLYSKKYLHSDENDFFVSGQNFTSLQLNNITLAFAICYELSVPEHSENAFKSGAHIYIASVAKSESGVEKAYESLADIARKYSMTVLMSNCVGPCDNFNSAGKTAIWNNKGLLVGQLDDSSEGILMIDTETQMLIDKTI